MQRGAHFLSAALILAIVFACGIASRCHADEQTDGAALYQKHCMHCHPDGSKLKLAAPLSDSLKTPPAGMPSFGPEKLTDRDVQALGKYLRPGAPPAPETEPARQGPAKSEGSSKDKKKWLKGFGTSDL